MRSVQVGMRVGVLIDTGANRILTPIPLPVGERLKRCLERAGGDPLS